MGARLDRRRDLRQHQERRRPGLQHGALQRHPQGRRDLERRELCEIDGEEITRRHFANGCVLAWNLTSLLVVPLPPSMWNGARVAYVVKTAFPFHPAFVF